MRCLVRYWMPRRSKRLLRTADHATGRHGVDHLRPSRVLHRSEPALQLLPMVGSQAVQDLNQEPARRAGAGETDAAAVNADVTILHELRDESARHPDCNCRLVQRPVSRAPVGVEGQQHELLGEQHLPIMTVRPSDGPRVTRAGLIARHQGRRSHLRRDAHSDSAARRCNPRWKMRIAGEAVAHSKTASTAPDRPAVTPSSRRPRTRSSRHSPRRSRTPTGRSVRCACGSWVGPWH